MFQPQIGSTIKGVVKHISHGHVAVIIYRVFNVSIRFNRSAMQDSLHINREISFRVKKFELQSAMPYIEGELIDSGVEYKPSNNHLTFEYDPQNGDSGISTKDIQEISGTKVESETDKSSDKSDSESSENSNEELINDLLYSNVSYRLRIQTIH